MRLWGTMQATSLHILVEGIGELTARREYAESATSMVYSGYIFDLAICNAFGVYIGLERAPIMLVTHLLIQPVFCQQHFTPQ